MPFTASLCITFSVISIMKAVMEFNVTRVHFETPKLWSDFFKNLPIYFDMMPFLAAGAFFRIASIIFIMTYLQVLGLVPIIIFLIANIVINQITLKEEMDHVPNWLIMFMSLFVPACFSTKSTLNLRRIQIKTFR